MNVEFRRWAVDDLKKIPPVILEPWLDAYASSIPEADLRAYYEEFYAQKNLKDLYDDQNVNGYVAVDGNSLVGFIRTKYNREEQRHYVSSLYILPRHQGKGIGSRFMELAADEARTRGLDRLWIGVMVENKAGLDFYRRLGYTIHEEQPFTMGNTSVSHYIGYVMLTAINRVKKK